MTGRPPKRLTRQQIGFLALLTVHAAFWLTIMIVWPSLHVGLICLSSFLAALAAVALALSVHGAARQAQAVVQPECGRCGCTDLTFAHAAGAGWVKVQGVLSCRLCASGFPSWMRGPI
ncbi:hypothetical protein [Streptomyces prunicolor]|uniref:hypothetical protein n=1 Tax=Streptomyces prunicolor TaxID=67348 RepID=UPI00342145B1